MDLKDRKSGVQFFFSMEGGTFLHGLRYILEHTYHGIGPSEIQTSIKELTHQELSLTFVEQIVGCAVPTLAPQQLTRAQQLEAEYRIHLELNAIDHVVQLDHIGTSIPLIQESLQCKGYDWTEKFVQEIIANEAQWKKTLGDQEDIQESLKCKGDGLTEKFSQVNLTNESKLMEELGDQDCLLVEPPPLADEDQIQSKYELDVHTATWIFVGALYRSRTCMLSIQDRLEGCGVYPDDDYLQEMILQAKQEGKGNGVSAEFHDIRREADRWEMKVTVPTVPCKPTPQAERSKEEFPTPTMNIGVCTYYAQGNPSTPKIIIKHCSDDDDFSSLSDWDEEPSDEETPADYAQVNPSLPRIIITPCSDEERSDEETPAEECDEDSRSMIQIFILHLSPSPPSNEEHPNKEN